MEVINTGNLKRIGSEDTEDVKANKLFQGVFGVGGFLRLFLNRPCQFIGVDLLMLRIRHTSYGESRGEDGVYVV